MPSPFARLRRFAPNADGWTLGFLAVLFSGAVLRLWRIGRYGFWTDELFHVFAARSFLTDGTFAVPWLDQEYTRAMPITLITALAFKLFGEDEVTGRLFFALTNVLFVAVGYLVIRQLLSRPTALVWALAMSFSVFAIQMSQEVRMYVVLQLLYFLMSAAFLCGIERAPRSRWIKRWEGSWRFQQRHEVSFGLLMGSLVVAGMAVMVQVLALSFGLVAAAYLAVMFINEWSRAGFRRAARTKYAVVLAAGTLVTVASGALWPDGVANLWRDTAGVPFQQTGEPRFAFYLRILQESHPILWALFPVGAFLSLQRHGRTGLFFVLSFLIPFIFHSFVFGRTAERYIFHLLPFFLAVSGTAVALGLELVEERAGVALRSLSRLRRWALVASVCVTALLMIRTTVANASVRKFPGDWKDLDVELVRSVSNGVVITTERMGFTYYFDRSPDFVLGVEDPATVGGLNSLSGVAAVVRQNADVWLVTYGAQFNSDVFVSEPIRDYVAREFERVDDRQDDDRIMVFRVRRP